MPFSPLAWFDRLVPKDPGTKLVAADLAFGPNRRHRLDLYAPSRPTGPLPLLIFVYGGGWNGGRRDEYHFAGRAFAGLGFLTAVPDYRVFPEVGFPGFVDDLGRAASWFVANAAAYGGDPSRVVLAGHSAGAYNAVMLGLDPARFGAPELVDRIASVVGLSGPYDFYPFDVKASIDAFGRADDPERTQPVNLVTSATPPMLLAHGVADTVVGDYHTVRLCKKLRAAGVPVVERHYPGMGHEPLVLGLARPLRRVLPVYRDVAEFLSSSVNHAG
jgi:acetyl esterase/lipase